MTYAPIACSVWTDASRGARWSAPAFARDGASDATHFLLAVALVGAALLAPVVLIIALVLLIRAGWRSLGRQLLAWGALGAAGCAAAGLGLSFALGEAATLGGILAGTAAGFTTWAWRRGAARVAQLASPRIRGLATA